MCSCKERKEAGSDKVEEGDMDIVALGLKPELVANHATAFELLNGTRLIVPKGQHNMSVQRRIQRELMFGYPRLFPQHQEAQLVPA